MAWSIHKPGQGYWVRVMTAVLAGVATLAAAAWTWNQAKLIDLPMAGWRVTLTDVQGAIEPGRPVRLLSESIVEAEEASLVGQALVQQFTPSQSGGSLVIESFDPAEGFRDPLPARRVVLPETSAGGDVAAVSGIPVFPPQYLWAGVAAITILIGTSITYWLVGVKHGTVEFLIATDNEMKKVNWSNRKDVMNSTLVVIIASVLIAAGLFAADLVFSQFFKAVGVLQN